MRSSIKLLLAKYSNLGHLEKVENWIDRGFTIMQLHFVDSIQTVVNDFHGIALPLVMQLLILLVLLVVYQQY